LIINERSAKDPGDPFGMQKRLSERHEPVGFCRWQEKDLVLLHVYEATKTFLQFRELDGGELAIENGILHVVPISPHGAIDPGEALRVPNVVADDVPLERGAHLTTKPSYWEIWSFIHQVLLELDSA
jgi:hypothetical protein